MTRRQAAQARERSRGTRGTVLAAVERGGRIKATVLPRAAVPSSGQVVQWVRPEAIVYTDEWPAYNRLGDHFADHSRVIHTAGIYVDGRVHTNTSRGSSATSRPASAATTRRSPCAGSRGT